MRRASLLTAATFLLAFGRVSPAFGAEMVPRTLDLGVGAIALVLAAVLMIEVVALRRVASGAAIAEHVSYIVAAVLCLAAAVIWEWVVRFLTWDGLAGLANLASDLLVIAAMVFFGLYFHRVRRAMLRFLTRFSAEDAFVQAQCTEENEGGATDRDGSAGGPAAQGSEADGPEEATGA